MKLPALEWLGERYNVDELRGKGLHSHTVGEVVGEEALRFAESEGGKALMKAGARDQRGGAGVQRCSDPKHLADLIVGTCVNAFNTKHIALVNPTRRFVAVWFFQDSCNCTTTGGGGGQVREREMQGQGHIIVLTSADPTALIQIVGHSLLHFTHGVMQIGVQHWFANQASA